MKDSPDTLGGVHPRAASSRRSCHVCSLQAVYHGCFFISLLPRFLNCHLRLMAVLISCIWKTHWSLPATFAVRLGAEFSCLSHPSQPHSLAVGTTNDAKRKSSNYLQLSLSAYIASRCVLTRLLHQCCEKPLIWNNIHHVQPARATWGTEQAVVHLDLHLLSVPSPCEWANWAVSWDNSTQFSAVIYWLPASHTDTCCQDSLVNWGNWGKCLSVWKPHQRQVHREFNQVPRDSLLLLSGLVALLHYFYPPHWEITLRFCRIK